jgi:hypothetical protein
MGLEEGVATGDIARCDVPVSFKARRRLARDLSRADADIPEWWKGNPWNVLVTMMRAVALDVPLMVMADHWIVKDDEDGFASAQLVLGLMRRDGHRVSFPVTGRERAELLVQPPRASRPYRVEYTMLDAQQAGLRAPDRDPDGFWDRFPADMLVARVITRAGRQYATGSLLGIGRQGVRRDAGGMGVHSDAVSPYKDKDRDRMDGAVQKAVSLTRIADAVVRVEALRNLADDYRDLLDFAAWPDRPVSLRVFLAGLIRQGADALGDVGGDVLSEVVDKKKRKKKKGGKKERKAAGDGVLPCGRSWSQALSEGHTCSVPCPSVSDGKEKK